MGKESLVFSLSLGTHKIMRKSLRIKKFFFVCLVGWLFLEFFFLLLRAAGAAYGSSQARGPVRAVAARLHHSHSSASSELHL